MPPPLAVPQLRDSHTRRAETAGSEDIFGVPELQCTRMDSPWTHVDESYVQAAHENCGVTLDFLGAKIRFLAEVES